MKDLAWEGRQNNMDFNIEAHYQQIVHILHAQREFLSLRDPLDTVTIAPLGVCEHNVVLHIVVNERQHLAMRVAYYPPNEHGLPLEFALLQKLPAGFGPQPLYLDTSKQVLPYFFAFLSYVPGTTPCRNWRYPPGWSSRTAFSPIGCLPSRFARRSGTAPGEPGRQAAWSSDLHRERSIRRDNFGFHERCQRHVCLAPVLLKLWRP